jgi:large subunit ribosomal protein L33
MSQKAQERLVKLACTKCKRITHWSSRRKKGEGAEKLALNKFCNWCRKHQPHKEVKK